MVWSHLFPVARGMKAAFSGRVPGASGLSKGKVAGTVAGMLFGVWMVLATGTGYCGEKDPPVKQPEAELWKLVVISGCVIVSEKLPDSEEPEAVEPRPGIVAPLARLTLTVRETLKGDPQAHTPGTKGGGTGPDADSPATGQVRVVVAADRAKEMAAQMSASNSGSILFLQWEETLGGYFLSSCAGESTLQEATPAWIEAVRNEIRAQEEIVASGAPKDPAVSPSMARKVKKYIAQLQDSDTFHEACVNLERLGPKALPALVPYLRDHTIIPEQTLQYVTPPYPGSWEAIQHRGVGTVWQVAGIVCPLLADDLTFAQPENPPPYEAWLVFLHYRNEKSDGKGDSKYTPKILPPDEPPEGGAAFIRAAEKSYKMP